MQVITDGSTHIEIAGIASLSFKNLPTISPAKCCASAALPPFPASNILLPFRIISESFFPASHTKSKYPDVLNSFNSASFSSTSSKIHFSMIFPLLSYIFNNIFHAVT